MVSIDLLQRGIERNWLSQNFVFLGEIGNLQMISKELPAQYRTNSTDSVFPEPIMQ